MQAFQERVTEKFERCESLTPVEQIVLALSLNLEDDVQDLIPLCGQRDVWSWRMEGEHDSLAEYAASMGKEDAARQLRLQIRSRRALDEKKKTATGKKGPGKKRGRKKNVPRECWDCKRMRVRWWNGHCHACEERDRRRKWTPAQKKRQEKSFKKYYIKSNYKLKKRLRKRKELASKRFVKFRDLVPALEKTEKYQHNTCAIKGHTDGSEPMCNECSMLAGEYPDLAGSWQVHRSFFMAIAEAFDLRADVASDARHTQIGEVRIDVKDPRNALHPDRKWYDSNWCFPPENYPNIWQLNEALRPWMEKALQEAASPDTPDWAKWQRGRLTVMLVPLETGYREEWYKEHITDNDRVVEIKLTGKVSLKPPSTPPNEQRRIQCMRKRPMKLLVFYPFEVKNMTADTPRYEYKRIMYPYVDDIVAKTRDELYKFDGPKNKRTVKRAQPSSSVEPVQDSSPPSKMAKTSPTPPHSPSDSLELSDDDDNNNAGSA